MNVVRLAKYKFWIFNVFKFEANANACLRFFSFLLNFFPASVETGTVDRTHFDNFIHRYVLWIAI